MRKTVNFAVPHPTRLCRATFPPGEGILQEVSEWHIIAVINPRISVYDPSQPPLVTWRGHANLLFNNWLNYYVYQATPYRLEDIK